MTTTSSADQFDTASYSGRAWTNYANLENDGGEAYATISIPIPNTGTILLATPGFMTSLDDGSEFVSLKVTFEDKMASSYGATGKCRLTGGTWLTAGSIGTSYTSRTQDGDESYWGISGTPQEIFSGLKDGSIKFEFKAEGGLYATGNIYLKDVEATLTYKLADTKRASILVTMP